MAHDVFISYAREDAGVAEKVCRALEDGGVRCWIAPRDVPYGVPYEQAIMDAIEAAAFLVLVFSSHANASQHVGREIRKAFEECSATQVFPFRVENVDYNKVLYYYLGGAQWLDATTPPLEDHLRRLVEHVRARMPRPPAPATPQAAEPPTRGHGSATEPPPVIPTPGDSPVGGAGPAVDEPAVDEPAVDKPVEDETVKERVGGGRKTFPAARPALAAGALLLLVIIAVAAYNLSGGDAGSANGGAGTSTSQGTSGPLAPTPGPQTTDDRLAAAVRERLHSYPGLRAVEVAVKDGRVTLSGYVYSWNCSAAAEKISQGEGVLGITNYTAVRDAPRLRSTMDVDATCAP